MSAPDDQLPPSIGHYRLTRKLGEGGLGVVFAAFDERLQRDVAIKLLRQGAVDAAARDGFWREARMAAAISHPNVCRLYDVGEAEGRLYLAMELLEGEQLAELVRRGPLPLPEAKGLTLELLRTLEVVHARGMIHRDLKPANLMRTQHGLKVLDFGLAHREDPAGDVTRTAVADGSLSGTPSYMAPEVINGQPAREQADLFAVGAILYELITGRRAFPGATVLAALNSVLNTEPPALPAAPALDRVVRRAIAKNPAERFASASEFAAALADLDREPAPPTAVNAAPPAPTPLRLIVMPFRMLRPDEEIGFLAASLPDAITTTLSGLRSLVVRSSVVAARFTTSEVPDLERLASEAGVDVVLTGTLVRLGNRLRVSAQLLRAPGGEVLSALSEQGGTDDLFALQDQLSRRIVDALQLTLAPADVRALNQPAPNSSAAYEIYLRANAAGQGWRTLGAARDLYREFLARDENYAPAWARLGRCYRLMAKYEGDPVTHAALAEQTFARALALQPDLDLAHSLYAAFEAENGRPREATVRLLGCLSRQPQSAELVAGLVYTCRLCGLVRESMWFHQEAARLDPLLPTSVVQTMFQTCDFAGSLNVVSNDRIYIDAAAMALLNRAEEAADLLDKRVAEGRLPPMARALCDSLRELLLGHRAAAVALMLPAMGQFKLGPEETLYFVRHLAYGGAVDEAFAHLDAAIESGWGNSQWLESDPWFAALREDHRFAAVRARIQSNEQRAREMFRAASPGHFSL